MADETTSRTDLADLVRRRREELQLPYRKFEQAAVDPEDPEAGPVWRRGTLQNLADGLPVKAPGAPQLRALAAALRLPLRAVQDAAAAQFFDMDILYDEDEEARLMAHRYREMSPEDQAKVRAILDAFSG